MPTTQVPAWARSGAVTSARSVSDRPAKPAGGGGKGSSGTAPGSQRPTGGGPKPAGGGSGKGSSSTITSDAPDTPSKPAGGGGKGSASGGGGAGGAGTAPRTPTGGRQTPGTGGAGGAQPTNWWEMTGGAWGNSGMPAWAAPEEGVVGDAARSIVRSNPILDEAAKHMRNIASSGTEARGLAVDQIFKGSGAGKEYGRASSILDNMYNPNWYDEAASNELFSTRDLAAKSVNAHDIRNDAAVKESVRQFREAELPLIENMSALSGLGRSTAVTNAAAARQAATMLPLLQEATGRAERRQNRILDAALQRAGGYSQKGSDIANRRLNAAGQSVATGAQMTSDAMNRADRLMQVGQSQRADDERLFDKLFQLGDYGRNLEQEQQDANRDDWLRLAGMFENSINGPAGLIPGLFGAQTTGGKK